MDGEILTMRTGGFCEVHGGICAPMSNAEEDRLMQVHKNCGTDRPS